MTLLTTALFTLTSLTTPAMPVDPCMVGLPKPISIQQQFNDLRCQLWRVECPCNYYADLHDEHEETNPRYLIEIETTDKESGKCNINTAEDECFECDTDEPCDFAHKFSWIVPAGKKVEAHYTLTDCEGTPISWSSVLDSNGGTGTETLYQDLDCGWQMTVKITAEGASDHAQVFAQCIDCYNLGKE